jgi:hypothetical protein
VRACVRRRKNPIPRAWKTKDGKWGKGSNQFQTGMGFEPVCDDDGMDKQGTKQSCTGMWGPYNLEIVDKVTIPKDLAAGEWVINWRMDQEESNQVRLLPCLSRPPPFDRWISVVADFLTEIYLCNVCSCQEILRRSGRG